MTLLAPEVLSNEPFMAPAPEGESPNRAVAFLAHDATPELCVAAGSNLYRFDLTGRCLAAHRLPWAFPHRGVLRSGGRRLLAAGASRAVVIDMDSGALLESQEDVAAALSDSGETAAFGPFIPRTASRRFALWRVGAPETRYPPPGTGMGRPLWVNDQRDALVDSFDRVELYQFKQDIWTTVADRAGRGAGGYWYASTDGQFVAYATHSEFRLFSVEERRQIGMHKSSMTSFVLGPRGLVAGSDHRGSIFLLSTGAEKLQRRVIGKMPGGATALAFSMNGDRLAAATWQDPRTVILSIE